MLGGHDIEAMPECKDHDAGNGVKRLMAALVQAERPGHDTKAKGAHGARQQEIMFANSAPKREGPNDHGQRQTHFVNDWLAEEAAGRREQSQNDRRRDAMNGAQP